MWDTASSTDVYKRADGFYVYAYFFNGTCVAHGAKPNKVGSNIDSVMEHVGAYTVNGSALQERRIALVNDPASDGIQFDEICI